jgi:fibro-slime domain-containing protein
MKNQQSGFILIFSILMLLGISTLAIGMVYNAHHGQVTAQNYKNRVRAFFAADGMRALLAQEVLDGNAKRYVQSSLTGEIVGEVWNGASTLALLKTAMASRAPNKTVKSNYLGSNWKGTSNYGVRWRGYVIPPATGSYTFFLRADNQGEFYLSSDESPGNKSALPIAKVANWAFSWPATGTGVSKPVSLKIGKRYYFELLHTQGFGDGFGQVGWSGPSYMVERPIPGKRLSAFGSLKEKWDTTKVGKGRVKYILAEIGPLVYTLNTEAMMGGKGDTTFRAPLTQTLSLRGDNPAPPAILWQRVIYYDFRTNGSNPEFERGLSGPVIKNMVRTDALNQTTENADWFGLPTIGKPMRGTNVTFNCGVDKWFTPWKSGWNFTYNYAGGPSDCSTTSTPGNDRAFENIVFKDSLPFVQRKDLGANSYQFKRSGALHAADFVPLDGKGFGHEGKKDLGGNLHNYGFCMEIHTQFEHTSGMVFDFNGDDDVWLFVNNSLVMDLGMVHGTSSGTVSLDDLPLTFGETYPLDFFYCERQTTGSSIDLITNLPMLLRTSKPVSSWKRDYGNMD